MTPESVTLLSLHGRGYECIWRTVERERAVAFYAGDMVFSVWARTAVEEDYGRQKIVASAHWIDTAARIC